MATQVIPKAPLVRFSPLKHHLKYFREQVIRWRQLPWSQVEEELVELGTNQYDIYSGELEVMEIVAQVEGLLLKEVLPQKEAIPEGELLVAREALHQWLGKGGYRGVTLNDGSQWVIRASDPGPTVAHLHPARNQPAVTRLKANHVKTAVALLWSREAIAGIPAPGQFYPPPAGSIVLPYPNTSMKEEDGIEDFTANITRSLNRVRRELPGLSPVRSAGACSRILATLRFLFPGQWAE